MPPPMGKEQKAALAKAKAAEAAKKASEKAAADALKEVEKKKTPVKVEDKKGKK